ncbi:MAG: DUF5615 family PIN-like protein [Acidobacteria bacterium]|nr:DUF5615 family PIN-like protein [Acidobacteriota bacterium]MCW5968707.1 DUF5615 family PIN-like protein [Blastocatellales bacterium]
MLRLFIDQDFDQDILRGLMRRVAEVEAVTAYQVDLSNATDQELLIWAAKERRIVLTHDRRTMPQHVADLLNAGQAIAGVIVVPRQLRIRQAIDELELIVLCSEENEWANNVWQLLL